MFKNFFCNLANNLVEKLPTPPQKIGKLALTFYYKNLKLKKGNFKFSKVSEENVLEFLQDIDPSKSAGIDNIAGKFIKDRATVLAKPITQLCNLSIETSKFPSSCKIAKLKPIFKKGSKTDPQNYRPISLF